MKRFICIVLTLGLVLSLCACGNAELSCASPLLAKKTVEEKPAETVPDFTELLGDAFIDPNGEWDRYDGLIASAKKEKKDSARTELLSEAEKILMANSCIIPLFFDEEDLTALVFNADSAMFSGMSAEQAACLRKAVSLLIDRSYLAEKYGGKDCSAAEGLIKGGTDYFDAMAITDDFDRTAEQAKALMEAAGFKFDENNKLEENNPVSFVFICEDDKEDVGMAQSLMQDLSALSVDMKIEKLSESKYEKLLDSGDYDAVCIDFDAQSKDIFDVLSMWKSNSKQNYAFYGEKAA